MRNGARVAVAARVGATNAKRNARRVALLCIQQQSKLGLQLTVAGRHLEQRLGLHKVAGIVEGRIDF